MSNVIDFLERLGQDSLLRYAPSTVLDRALSDAQVSPELRSAVMSGNHRVLESLLGARSNVCCLGHAPQRKEDEDEKPRKAKEDDEAQSALSLAHLRRIA
jgi:hypothetical protein